MDSLELKVPEEDLEEHLRKVRSFSSMDKDKPHRKSKGDRSAGQVYEGQTAEHCGTGPRHVDPVHGITQDKYDRTRTGEQGDAPLGDCL